MRCCCLKGCKKRSLLRLRPLHRLPPEVDAAAEARTHLHELGLPTLHLSLHLRSAPVRSKKVRRMCYTHNHYNH